MEIEKEYQKLAKKHKLPSFENLNNEFEISTIEEEDFLLREVRRKIAEKIELYIKLVEPVLQPEATVCDMHECKASNEEEKKKIYDLYKRLMYLDRFSVETSVDEDDGKSSLFINEVWEEWANIKKEFVYVIIKLKESWLKESDIKEELGYLG